MGSDFYSVVVFQMDEQQASLARQGELESLRRQEELLQILVEKQDQVVIDQFYPKLQLLFKIYAVSIL